jgi:hypothetical protein
MAIATRTRRFYPNTPPAYYLGRPAHWWITALAPGCRRRAGQTIRPHEPSTATEAQ